MALCLSPPTLALLPHSSPPLSHAPLAASHGPPSSPNPLRTPPSLTSAHDRRALLLHATTSICLLCLPSQSLADDQFATAIFSAGDPRFLQPGFDDIKYLGVKRTEMGAVESAGVMYPAIKVSYNAKKLSYQRLIGAFWRGVDPTRSSDQGQFGSIGPTIIWTANEEEEALAVKSRALLDASTRFRSPTFGPMYKGQPVLTEIRRLDGSWERGPDADQDWYLNQPKQYEVALKKSGRRKWFDDAYKPVTVTACESNRGEGTVCGFVYFPCSDENGCTAVMNGRF